MAKVLVHCPLNISRTLEEMLKGHCQKVEDRLGTRVELETQPHRPLEKGLFEKYIEEGNLPELVIGHVNDFADLPEGYLEEHFLPLPGRWPLRKELMEAGFLDPRGYFNPFVVIPFAMFYNTNLLDEGELPTTWEELLEVRWREKILMPDDYRVVSKVILTFMEAHYPERFPDFQKNVIHEGAPIDVVNNVDEGNYAIGITNIAFARISRHKNTRLIWPKDGLFCMPQVMVWNKNSPESLLEIGDYLMSDEVQDYLALQAFVPASPDVAIPKLLAENDFSLRWEGWEHYLSVVKGAKM
ncbi:MAG: ABC transporter substrate-binding protein [Firmicutes bacterium]|nr:ABC transporter substrate-binding protein [Bacillota bacterium]